MTDARLRTHIGLFWIIAHLVVLGTVMTCFFLGGFEFDQMTTLLAVIVPMFAGTTMAIVRYFAQHRHDKRKGRVVNRAYTTLTWLLPVAFTITILATIVLRATNRAFDDFDQAKLFLAGLEALFVAYIAYLLAPLFEAPPTALRAPPDDRT